LLTEITTNKAKYNLLRHNVPNIETTEKQKQQQTEQMTEVLFPAEADNFLISAMSTLVLEPS
jgi:hypothetical protein